MEIVAAALIIVSMVAIAAATILIIRRSINSFLRSMLISPGEGQPSPAMAALMAVGQAIGAQLRESLSAALMGHSSALSKQIQGIEQDVAQDHMQTTNPLLTALLQFSPSLRKRLTKSPLAAMALQALPLESILAKAAGGLGAVPKNGGQPPTPQGGFELGK